MKIQNLMYCAALVLGMTACDKVDMDERYVDVEPPAPETPNLQGKGYKPVLVEEFTGQFCINCPQGHSTMNQIKNLYPGRVVSVSIHAGMLAYDDATYGLKTPEGDQYASQWNVQAYPSIVVNRKGEPISNTAEWQGAVIAGIAPFVDIEMDVKAEIEDGKLKVIPTVAVPAANMREYNVKYQAWVIENNIVTLQQTPADYDMNYVHNHVYRAAFNGVGGEDVVISRTVSPDLTRSINIDPRWNADNLGVVVFLYDGNGVVQVAEATVKGDEAEE